MSEFHRARPAKSRRAICFVCGKPVAIDRLGRFTARGGVFASCAGGYEMVRP